MPRALLDVPNVAVEPFTSLLEDKSCAVLLSVLAPTDSVCYVAVANPSNLRVEIPTNVPVAAVAPVAMAYNSSSTTAAVAPQLSRNEKLSKVLRELHVNALPDSLSCASTSTSSPKAIKTSALRTSQSMRLIRPTRERFVSLFVDCRMAKCARQ